MRKQQLPNEISFSFSIFHMTRRMHLAGTHFQTYYLSAKGVRRSLVPHKKRPKKYSMGFIPYQNGYYWLLLSFSECRKLHYAPLGKTSRRFQTQNFSLHISFMTVPQNYFQINCKHYSASKFFCEINSMILFSKKRAFGKI